MLSLPKIIAPVRLLRAVPGAARYAGRLACHFIPISRSCPCSTPAPMK